MEYLQYFKGGKYEIIRCCVLNLVISGIPSILWKYFCKGKLEYSFKPCYKWNTFNTWAENALRKNLSEVLNLVISGIPSILTDGSK